VAPAPAAPAPTEAQRTLARTAYARGQALFAEGKYSEAKAAFAEAYAAVPNPVVLLSAAECDVRLGLLEEAHEALHRYLTEKPDAADRAEVEKKLAELAALPATFVLSSEPAGATIKLDGKDTGQVTPAEVQTTRGARLVELTLAGHHSASDTVTARIGARHELHVALQALPPPPPKAPVAPEPEPEREQPPTTALWITSIVGAAGLVTGTVLGFVVLAERSDFDAKPTEASADRGERLALFADVAFGVGAMALITGAVLYLTSGDATEPAPSTARLRLGAQPVRDGAAVVAHGQF
jgi:tetratricopeptide (TPR) repeat protein